VRLQKRPGFAFVVSLRLVANRIGGTHVFQPGRKGTARIGVLTILDVEFRAAKRALAADHEIPDSGYYTPDESTLNVVLAWGDRGNSSATAAAKDLIEDFRPEVLILTGIAGGLQRERPNESTGITSYEIAPGDLIVPDYLHYAALRSIKRKSGDNPRHVPHDPPAASLHWRYVRPIITDNAWRARIRETPPGGHYEPRVRVAPLVAGECIYGDESHPEQVRLLTESEFQDALAVDMESIGVAVAVHSLRNSPIYNPRLLVVRGISDPVRVGQPSSDRLTSQAAPEDPNATREEWRPYAADVAAAFTAALVDKLLGAPDLRPFMATATSSYASRSPKSVGVSR
jgi:nucleoside phosphorylase